MNDKEQIKIARGATKILTVDLTGYEMNKGGSVIFVIRELDRKKIVFTKEFKESKVYTFEIPDDLTRRMKPNRSYGYDFFYHLRGARFRITEIEKVTVSDTVGGDLNV